MHTSCLRRSSSPLRLFASACIAIALPVLAGCESLRPHDQARLKTAEQAVEEAAALTAGGGAVFGPMEENLEAVRQTQAKLRELTNKHEYEAFKPLVPSLSPNEIGTKLADAMEGRNAALADIEMLQTAAAKSVNEALDRQALISAAIKGEIAKKLSSLREEMEAARGARNNERVKQIERQIVQLEEIEATEGGANERSLEHTLARAKLWLEWIDRGLQAFSKAQDALTATTAQGTISDKAPAALDAASAAASPGTDLFAGFVEDAQKSLDEVDKAEPLVAARQLLRSAVEQTATAEQERLLEFQRHLGEVKRLRNRLRTRDKISVCELYVAALGSIYAAVTNQETKKRLEEITFTLMQSGRYNIDADSCLPSLAGDDRTLRAQWAAGRLDAYVAAALKGGKPNDPPLRPSRLIGSLGVLLFYEREMFEKAHLELAQEQHRHSILLSRINAGQRAGLVHQLVQGLAIYYQGGVKPEEVAQLFLLATQVGGLFFIGSQL